VAQTSRSKSRRRTLRKIKRSTTREHRLSFFRKEHRFHWFSGIFFTACLSLIFYFDFTKFVFRENFSSTRTYIARVDFTCPDVERTTRERRLRADRVPPVFIPREGWVEALVKPLDDFAALAGKSAAKDMKGMRMEWEEKYPSLPFPERLLSLGEPKRFRELTADVKAVLLRYREKMIPAEYVDSEQRKIITVIGADGRENRVVAQDLSPRGEVLRKLRTEVKAKYGAEAAEAVLDLVDPRLAPSLVRSDELTRELREKAAAEVPLFVKEVKKGTVIVREGEIITRAIAVELEEEQRAFTSSLTLLDKMRIVGGHVVFALALVVLTGVYMRFFGDEIGLSRGKMFLYFVFLMFFLAVGRVMAFFGIPANAVPIVFIGMVTAIVVNIRFAVMMVFVFSLVVGYIFRVNVDYSVAVFSSGLASVFFCSHLRRRMKILEGGCIAGLVNVAVLYGITFSRSLALSPSWMMGVAGFTSAMGSSVVLIGVLPLVEYIFDTATDIRLLELSDQGHPLLRNLFLLAPGTYTHSLAVGNLAESAAEAVGADTLLARVASYYHDIGKIFKPEYYIENQTPGRNKHDNLKPSLSSLIISSHTRDGVELGREYNLPRPILDIIAQHHGTSKIVFFLQKAQTLAENGEVPDEAYFRYPGPKPSTREAGIVMLADAIEAASRTLSNPSPQSLRKMVERIIQAKLDDHQLDETPLTMVELARVREAFISVLYSIFHSRIEYPEEHG